MLDLEEKKVSRLGPLKKRLAYPGPSAKKKGWRSCNTGKVGQPFKGRGKKRKREKLRKDERWKKGANADTSGWE